ncbi:MAG: hypothetical protein VR72_07590 [Clostridiaceae bacterium BRH_c20a]|nr:MAG: hypothetical protein VR72_07590 [Clostridiaceae bacterium BRH_c20a]
MRKLILFIFLVSLLFSVGCQTKDQRQNYQNIKPDIAYEQLQKEKDIILLDVRTIEEYNEKHIPRSLLIPVEVLKEEVEEKIKDKEAKIFVYCRSGNRSAAAAKILAELGYTNVFNLGGINDWKYDTESKI